MRESKETKEQNSAKLAIKKLRIVVPPSVALGGRASSSSWKREEQVEGGREEGRKRAKGKGGSAVSPYLPWRKKGGAKDGAKFDENLKTNKNCEF